MLETLDYTIRIGSTPTILYFDFYLYSAYAAHYVYFNFGSGTIVVVKTVCNNSKCPQKESVWYSQPNIGETNVSAGNFHLSMAILVAGGSASKVLQIFSHMGLAQISLNTFFRYQRVC